MFRHNGKNFKNLRLSMVLAHHHGDLWTHQVITVPHNSPPLLLLNFCPSRSANSMTLEPTVEHFRGHQTLFRQQSQ